MRILLALCAVAALAGCANQPISFAESKPVSPEKVISVGSGDSEIWLKRDAGYQSGGADVLVLINGKPRAIVWQGEKVRLLEKSGSAIIGVKYNTASNETLFETSVVLLPGNQNKFRISVTRGPEVFRTATE